MEKQGPSRDLAGSVKKKEAKLELQVDGKTQKKMTTVESKNFPCGELNPGLSGTECTEVS